MIRISRLVVAFALVACSANVDLVADGTSAAGSAGAAGEAGAVAGAAGSADEPGEAGAPSEAGSAGASSPQAGAPSSAGAPAQAGASAGSSSSAGAPAQAGAGSAGAPAQAGAPSSAGSAGAPPQAGAGPVAPPGNLCPAHTSGESISTRYGHTLSATFPTAVHMVTVDLSALAGFDVVPSADGVPLSAAVAGGSLWALPPGHLLKKLTLAVAPFTSTPLLPVDGLVMFCE